MATQYEVEHNIKPSAAPRRRRQVDMSTFTAHLNNVATAATGAGNSDDGDRHHNNPHATPTPVDVAAVFRLVQDQLLTLLPDAPTTANRALLEQLATQLEQQIADPPREIAGVSSAYLDALDRVPRKRLGADEACPICVERYLDDPYALVVELPCHASHRFDLECVGPWLLAKGSCPLCRTDLTKKKQAVVVPDDDDEDDDDTGGMFG
ncbi:Zinc finger, RING/FYVE/PHD-type [Niveomyces insectorum RCEF 264]|uniref:RING-type E3 ubiquitin transferase n=1 Tax=Niveomyces insectorum RCEF 264 TaxID=1081102 RepID=A0A167TXS4_9HYPO|nr:Zinc finger, RING/FYVE/PHD-type [Niveomyces insectorum RCEF 264]